MEKVHERWQGAGWHTEKFEEQQGALGIVRTVQGDRHLCSRSACPLQAARSPSRKGLGCRGGEKTHRWQLPQTSLHQQMLQRLLWARETHRPGTGTGNEASLKGTCRSARGRRLQTACADSSGPWGPLGNLQHPKVCSLIQGPALVMGSFLCAFLGLGIGKGTLCQSGDIAHRRG